MRAGCRDRGLTLVEVLLATTILLFAATATLIVYDDAWKFFKKGENSIEQQQAVRIAFDRLNQDLRVAGFNYNPDGDTSRPDEQIEAAFDTAVIIRADFDGQEPTLSATPETSLAGGAFDSVSTDNSEIVAYVLAKPDGSSADTLTFEADVKDSPRDGAVETIGIPNVALVHDNPPYSLYRITLNNDTSTWGSDNFIVSTLLAENMKSLSFRYFDHAGNQINAVFDLSTFSDDIGGSETSTAMTRRSSIQRVELELVGLTRDPDPNWVDPGDTNPATRSHRKFRLKTGTTARNIGMKGVRDLPPN